MQSFSQVIQNLRQFKIKTTNHQQQKTRSVLKTSHNGTIYIRRRKDALCHMWNIWYLTEERQVKILKNEKELKVNANRNCKTKNLIYCMKQWWNKHYIERTKMKRINRVSLHRHQITYPAHRCITCSSHLYTSAQRIFTIFLRHTINGENNFLQKTKVQYFMRHLGPKVKQKWSTTILKKTTSIINQNESLKTLRCGGI